MKVQNKIFANDVLVIYIGHKCITHTGASGCF